jgi:putative hemolysin
VDSIALTECAVILVLILLNGFFAAAEIAILTARRGRLEQQAAQRAYGAATALQLAEDADRFLPTVQVGITLVSTFAAAFGGASFVKPLAAALARFPLKLVSDNSGPLALTIVALVIAFASLILGELVPKRLALQHAEHLARWVALPMLALQRVSLPVVWFLRAITRGILAFLGQSSDVKQTVSVEDIQHLIESGREAGVLEHSEQRVAIEALKLGDRTVVDILRPRIEIDAIDIDTPANEVIGQMAMSGFSRVPVCEGSIDQITGFLYIKDVFLQQYLGRPVDIRRLMRPALFIPKTVTVSRLLELFQNQRTQLAIVLDEYGGTEGMVTLEDAVEVLIGDIHDEHRQDRSQDLVPRADGSLLVDGSLPLRELEEHYEISRWNTPPPRGVGTVSGLLLSILKRAPKVGDIVEFNHLRLEIVDMDGPRIDRLLISAQPETGSE